MEAEVLASASDRILASLAHAPNIVSDTGARLEIEGHKRYLESMSPDERKHLIVWDGEWFVK